MRIRSSGYSTLLAASIAVAAIACTPDSTAPADIEPSATFDKKAKDLEERYGWIGKYHTDGLEYVFAELAATKGKRDRASLCKVIDRAVKDFHRSARKGEVPFHLMDVSLFAGPCAEIKGAAAVSTNIISGTPRVAANTVSSLTMSYVDQVETAIFSAATKPALVSTLHHIQNSAIVNLPLEEAAVIIAVVSITMSSMEYWEMNLESWIGLGAGPGIAYSIAATTPPPVSATGFNWPRWWNHPFVSAYRKVVAADGIAAARVFYTTWRLGPIGWDAAAAAGVFGSITTAISLLF